MPVEDDIVRVHLATLQLKGLAKLWWKSLKNARGGMDMGWNAFEELFLRQYFPLIERRKRNKSSWN